MQEKTEEKYTQNYKDVVSCTQALQNHFIDWGNHTGLNLISELKLHIESNIVNNKHTKQTFVTRFLQIN